MGTAIASQYGTQRQRNPAWSGQSYRLDHSRTFRRGTLSGIEQADSRYSFKCRSGSCIAFSLKPSYEQKQVALCSPDPSRMSEIETVNQINHLSAATLALNSGVKSPQRMPSAESR